MSYLSDRHSMKGTSGSMARRRGEKRKARERRVAGYRHMDRKKSGTKLTALVDQRRKNNNPLAEYLGLLMGIRKIKTHQERG